MALIGLILQVLTPYFSLSAYLSRLVLCVCFEKVEMILDKCSNPQISMVLLKTGKFLTRLIDFKLDICHDK